MNDEEPRACLFHVFVLALFFTIFIFVVLFWKGGEVTPYDENDVSYQKINTETSINLACKPNWICKYRVSIPTKSGGVETISIVVEGGYIVPIFKGATVMIDEMHPKEL